jgi:hypothetical protein
MKIPSDQRTKQLMLRRVKLLESIYCVYIYRCDLLESILLESIYIYMNMIGDLNKHGGVLI